MMIIRSCNIKKYLIIFIMRVNLQSSPCLVLNADYQPLSYFPLSLWGWQETIKAVFLERVNIVAEYDISVKSTSFSMKLPSVISLKNLFQLKKMFLLPDLTYF